MISREEFLKSLLNECTIILHLYEKIPADAFDFRPSEKQRSMTDLLRYLAVCGTASMHVITNGSDWKTWKPFTDRSLTMEPKDFPAAMNLQMEEITKTINSIPEPDFHSVIVKHPAGEEMPLGIGLMRMSYSWLLAYRMQLFLYLKQVGITEIGTSNAWAGRDRQQPVGK
ncbi:MAG: hypothetical protein M3R17_20125 [Bacteroidota bacterium]|nr:hypothetical protein [Bacteroidota bacterium]